MKITFLKTVSHHNSFGGGSVHFSQLAKSLVARGNKIAVFQDGAALGDYRTFPHTRWGALNASLWSDVFYMRLALHSKKPGHLPKSLSVMRHARKNILAWEVNAPVEEIAVNGRGGLTEVKRKLEFIRTAANAVDVAFCVSEEMASYARDRIGLKNVHYVPNGANCTHFSPAVRSTTRFVKPDCPVILWMGSGHYAWEGDRMVIGLAERLKAHGIECLIVLAGNPREREEAYPQNVLHLGRVPHDELPSVVAAADICLCVYDVSAYGELGFYGSPIKLYEYMAAGKAIVATRVGEIERSIEDGISGLFVSNQDELDSAVTRLLADGQLRNRLGRAARDKAMKYYNWDRAAMQIEQAILTARVPASHQFA